VPGAGKHGAKKKRMLRMIDQDLRKLGKVGTLLDKDERAPIIKCNVGVQSNQEVQRLFHQL
jgi:hypothetical protein